MSGYVLPTTSAPDDTTLAALLQQAVVGVTGLDPTLVRPRWQSQPPTQPPYGTDWCAIGITNYRPVDYPEWSQDDDASGTQHRLERLDMLATFYGPRSAWFAGLFRDGLYLVTNFQVLRDAGLSLRSVDDTVHLGEEVGAQILQRSDVPASFLRFVERSHTIPSIAGTDVEFASDDGLDCTITVSQQ